MMRPGWLAELVSSGEYVRAARECTTDAELAKRLGADNANTLQKARQRLRAAGWVVPSIERVKQRDAGLEEMTRLSEEYGAHQRIEPPQQQGIVDAHADDFDKEPPTLPGIPVDVVPERHIIKGVSSFVVDGEVRGQWIKTTAQNDERAEWLEAIRHVSEDLPRIEPTFALDYGDDNLLAVYPVGDPHIGLLSWHEDAGENFDLAIAEQRYVAAFKHLLDLAPPAHEALIVLIGDTAHADGQNNTTTKGTRVDVDGRTVKIARTIIRVARYAIDLALAKHGRVTMIIERGNHDELISAMLALALSFVYEREPRVTIDTSPQMFHWYRFGANLIGTHHGDKVKPMDLLGVMAVDRADDWSATKHRRFYCGHYHHQIVKEVPGVIVEYLPTLASSDAWHHAMGYRSSKAMYMDVLHRERGHVNRHIVGLDQLRAA